MALRLWVTLNGNIDNRGVSGTEMSGTPNAWGDGRIGKCAVFTGVVGNRITCDTTDYNYVSEDFSWCIWVKKVFSSKSESYSAMWAFTVGRADAGGRGYGLRVYSTYVRAFFGNSSWEISTVPDNEWHHIAFTRKGTIIKLYLDGILSSTQTFTGTLPTYSDGNGPGIGCLHYTGDTYPLIGSVSDFRIYDHVLSDREVYQISRLLLLHFPLCSTNNAMPNLLTWANDYTAATPYVHSSSNTDGYKVMGASSLVAVTPGKTYYLQVKCDHSPKASHGNGGVVSDQFTIWFYIRTVGTSKSPGGYDRAMCFTSANIYVNKPESGIYVWKWTAGSNDQDVTLRTNTYSDGSTVVQMRFWDFKIEEGDYTPYVPSVNQPQYEALGYGSAVARDVSGWGADGQVSTQTPTYSVGSPRYLTAMNFIADGSAYIWPIPDPIRAGTEEFTISVWFNTTTTSGNQCIWNGRNSTSATAVGIFLASANIRLDDNGNNAIYTIEPNRWYHLVYTWKKGENKVGYVNGVQVYSGTANSITSKSNTYASIGRSSAADSISASNYFKGSISDFRIYGAALSATDVKELYSTGASIDNTGTVFSGEFAEIGASANAGKNAVFRCAGLTESRGTQLAHSTYNGDNPVYPRTLDISYVPSTGTNSTTSSPSIYVHWSTSIIRYHVSLDLTWEGFDSPELSTDFSLKFQGPRYSIDGTSEWSTNYLTNALNTAANPGNLIKATPSRGSYHYEVSFEIPAGHASSYIAARLGFRSDYSNGVGRVSCSHVYIYPADEHCDGMSSLTSTGIMRGRLLDEVGL